MLEVTINGDILTVIEYLFGWTAETTRTNYWYYDIKNWKKSIRGTEGSPIVQDMTPSQIDWVQKIYLPKVGI